MTYTAWSVVFGEQPSAAKWNQLGTNDAHFYGFLGDNLAWTSWTPTWTNLNSSTSTQNSSYARVGNIIICRLNLVWGASTSISGDVTFSLPVTARSSVFTNFQALGNVNLNDASGLLYAGVIAYATTTTAHLYVSKADSTYTNFAALSSTIPFTWTTSDGILGVFMYEAA